MDPIFGKCKIDGCKCECWYESKHDGDVCGALGCKHRQGEHKIILLRNFKTEDLITPEGMLLKRECNCTNGSSAANVKLSSSVAAPGILKDNESEVTFLPRDVDPVRSELQRTFTGLVNCSQLFASINFV
jgi:hypothetical protein